jgi:hydrogenase nickel incorporation protein HypA/HybF
MHEIGIANEIIKAGLAEVALRPGSTLCRVGVHIGILAGVDLEALRFAFDALTRGTNIEDVEFDLLSCPRRNRCLQCSNEFETDVYCKACPCCSSNEAALIGGEELDLAYVELEEA